MAILTTFRHVGDPDEIMRIAQEKVRPTAQEAGGEEGRISITVVRTEDGVMMVSLWETEEGMRRAAARLEPVARASGLPPQRDWRMYEVLAHAERHV
jgi:hypothetical protein